MDLPLETWCFLTRGLSAVYKINPLNEEAFYGHRVSSNYHRLTDRFFKTGFDIRFDWRRQGDDTLGKAQK